MSTSFDLVWLSGPLFSYLVLFVLMIWTINVCTGHAYNDQDRCVAAGYDNGDVKLFDLRAMSLRWETNVKNGVSVSVLKCLGCIIV